MYYVDHSVDHIALLQNEIMGLENEIQTLASTIQTYRQCVLTVSYTSSLGTTGA